MKTPIFVLLSTLVSLSAFSQEPPALNIEARCGYELDGGVARSTFHPVTISNHGQNSRLFALRFSRDASAQVLVGLNEVSKTCADSSCKAYSGTNYELSVIRYRSEIGNWENYLSKDKDTAKGRLADASRISLDHTTGEIKTSHIENGKASFSETFPDLVLEYSIKRDGLFRARQKIKFTCSFERK